MIQNDCPKCGGIHIQSFECPFTDEQILAMGGKFKGVGHKVSEGMKVISDQDSTINGHDDG